MRVFLDIQDRVRVVRPLPVLGFAPDAPIIGGQELICSSPLSDAIAKDLKKRGMRFMGSVTVYSYLQAIGVVNDHDPLCDFQIPLKGKTNDD